MVKTFMSLIVAVVAAFVIPTFVTAAVTQEKEPEIASYRIVVTDERDGQTYTWRGGPFTTKAACEAVFGNVNEVLAAVAAADGRPVPELKGVDPAFLEGLAMLVTKLIQDDPETLKLSVKCVAPGQPV